MDHAVDHEGKPLDQLSTTVVMCTYNGERFVEEQLASLLSQEEAPLEIIVSDDRSTDNTCKIVERIAETSKIRIHLRVNERNLGFGENFLSACTLSSGDLIAFCDQDDIWHPAKIGRCRSAFSDPDVMLTVHTAVLVDVDGRPCGDFKQGICKDRKMKPQSYDPWSVFFGFSMTFRREVLDLYPRDDRPFDYIDRKSKMSHDRWALFLANSVGSIYEIDQDLVKYRQHGNNIFGHDGKNSTQLVDLSIRSDGYLSAVRDFEKIANIISESEKLKFKTEDFRKSLRRIWQKERISQESRSRLHHCSGFFRKTCLLIYNVFHGAYFYSYKFGINIKSFSRDVVFVATGR
jgi:glycosyltransferase involved in cell wall biosynthesis